MPRFLLPGRAAAAGVLCALASLAACSDGDPPPTQPDPGSLEVVVNATGTDVDERFGIALNAEAAQAYTAGTPLVREGLAAGAYTVRISGISSNCTLQGADLANVTVTEGQRAQVTFNVTCAMRWVVVSQFSFVSPASDLYRVNRDGSNMVRLTNHPGSEGEPAVSPDGTRIAFISNRDGNLELYVMDVNGANVVRLTTLPDTHEQGPTWSPDGTRIAFSSFVPATSQSVIRIINANGTGLVDVPGGALPLTPPVRWSPDGSRLALTLQDASSDYNVHTMDPATGVHTRVTANTATDITPSWTADGRLVYTGVTPGTTGGVFTINADGSGSTPLFDVADQVEWHPTISPDGRWLAYEGRPTAGGPIRVYVVPVAGGTPVSITPDFFAGKPAWQP